MSEIIRLPQFMRDAEVRSGSFDEAENTIDVIFTTGSTGRRRTWIDGDFDEELVVNDKAVRLGRLNGGAPFLDSHDIFSLRSVLGSVVPGSAKVEKGKGTAKVKLTRRTEAAGVVQDIRDGVIRNISVGYKTHAVEKMDRKGKVPLHRVIDWEPWEISAVPIPFDAGAQIRSAGDLEKQELYECMVTRSIMDQNEVSRIRMRLAQATVMMAR
jgi:phage head maturation protease